MMRQGRGRCDAGDRREEQLDATEPGQPAAAVKARRATNGAAKEVSWADDKSLPPERYTFYREGTPPPSPPDDPGAAPDSPPGPEHRDDGYDYTYDRVAPPAPIPPATICGFRRRQFWIVAAVVALVVATGIAVGIGVGVGVGKNTQPKTPVTTTLPSPPQASSSSTSDDVAPTAIAACPAANNTKYLDPSTKKTFLLICGIDHSGAGQATDLGVVWTASMQECIVNCAGYPGCTGCGWGVIQGDAGSDHRCWLKGDLQEAHVVRPGWDFAILQ